LTEFSNTGSSEADNFRQQAKQFQATVKQEVYDKYDVKIYRSAGYVSSGARNKEGFETKNVPIPVLEDYKHVSTAKVFQENWIDIALLGFYCLLFFVCGFVSFLRFDVR
jgi:hypothetical protein